MYLRIAALPLALAQFSVLSVYTVESGARVEEKKRRILAGCKENHFCSLPFGQASPKSFLTRRIDFTVLLSLFVIRIPQQTSVARQAS